MVPGPTPQLSPYGGPETLEEKESERCSSPPKRTHLSVPLSGNRRREEPCPPAGAVPTTASLGSQRKPTAAPLAAVLPLPHPSDAAGRAEGMARPQHHTSFPQGTQPAGRGDSPGPLLMSLRNIKISHKNARGWESCKGPPCACVSKHSSGASGHRSELGTAVCQVGEMLGTVLQAYFQTWH